MSREEFKTYFDSYFDTIRNYLYYRSGDADLAADLAQEVFLKLWEKQPKIQEEKLKSLLYKMASNLFIDQIRKKKVSDKYMQSLNLDFVADAADAPLHYQELKANYELALAKLGEKQRVVFLMSRIESLTYQDIANRLNLSVKAVEKRMSIALAALKKEIESL